MGKWRDRRPRIRSVLTLGVALALVGTGCTWIGRASVNTAGDEVHGASNQAAVSADGRFVAFTSEAQDVVVNDFNVKRDVFVRDNSSGEVTRVSVTTDGTESDGDSLHPSISDDGRFVAFDSAASNLTPDDANAGRDVFVHDRELGTTVLASPVVGAAPAAGAGAAPNGGTPSPTAPSSEPKPSKQPDASVRGSNATATAPAADGTVRVVIRSSTDFQPESSLEPAERLEQRVDLASGRAAITRAVESRGGEVVRDVDGQPFVAARVPATSVAALRKDPSVSQVVTDYIVRPSDVASTALIGSSTANAAGIDGRGQTVAILDTGLDASHPFLAGRVVAEGCFTSTGTCPNQQNTQTGPGAAAPCPFDGCPHGTHVAGIAAGQREAGGSYDGVAPKASIIAVQIFSWDSGCQCLGAFSSDLIAGLQFVDSLRNEFDIAAVNMSLGGGPGPGNCDTEPLKVSIDELRSVGIATVIASGNEGSTTGIAAPACISSAVSVGAVDTNDLVASFSNSGPVLSLLAPGVAVESSLPGGGYFPLSGTSMAAPHVAGLWALFKQLQPNASVTGALAWLKATGRPLRDSRNGVVTSRVCAAVAFGLGSCPDPELPPPPVNDNFAAAIPLNGDTGTVAGTNVLAGVEVGEPNHAGQLTPTSVWYTFRPTATGALSLNTFGSEFDTVLALYTGSSVGSLTERGANDDARGLLQSEIASIPVTAGVTYRIAVSGYSGASGAFDLHWRFQPSLGDSTTPSISADGHLVAFASDVPSLIASDTNHAADVFVRNVTARATTRVSVTGNGAAADGPSSNPAISGDGSRVAFASAAANLVGSDTNSKVDVFVRNRTESTSLRRVSAATGGGAANGASDRPALDHTGTTIAFESDATNLVAGDANGARDVFVSTSATAPVQRVSVADDEREGTGASSGPSLSGDARFVAFTSGAPNLVNGDTKMLNDVFVRDRTDGTTRRISSAVEDTEATGPSSGAAISRDGSYVAFASTAAELVPNDGNGSSDVFLRRRQPVTITSVTPGTAERGQSLVFTILGSGFQAGAQITVPDATVTAVMVTSPTQIAVAVQVPLNAAPGNRNVVVQQPGASWNLSTGATALCVNCVRFT